MKPAFFILLTLLMGCGGNIVLDNPGTSSATFEFDGGDSYEVPAGEMEEISLDPGSHTVVVKSGGETVADTNFNMKEGGIVHAGQATYVVWRQLYGLQNERKTLLNEKWVEFDSVKTYGDFKIYRPEVVFIEDTWDYGLADDLPDAQSLYINKDFVVESKVFRSKEFIETYKAMAAQQPN